MKKIASLLIAAMSIYIVRASPLYISLHRQAQGRLDSRRMENVTAASADGAWFYPWETESQGVQALPEAEEAAVIMCAGTVVQQEEPAADGIMSPEQSRERDEAIRKTTIEGGLSVKNETGYTLDMGKLLLSTPILCLPRGEKQILLIHTHGSEAYTPAGLDLYEASDDCRTEDLNYNVVRVGDELCSIWEEAGLQVIHDRNIYDYPSYTGSYSRSGEAVRNWLAEYPGICVVIDIHRDALGEKGVIYKTMAEEEGVCASQAMLLVGTDESGLEHSDWEKNLGLALYLQRTVSAAHPTLMRPISLVPQRYNQHLSPGSLILEVGSSGNTLQEALAAVRLFGRAAAPALLALVEEK